MLRKTTARQIEERENQANVVLDAERQIGLLQQEIDSARKDLHRLSRSDALAQENTQLTKELNAARLEREQTHLINETLVRLHARESQKATQAESQLAQLAALPHIDAPSPEMAHLQEKLTSLLSIEVLYNQIRKQFDEKNQILHENPLAAFQNRHRIASHPDRERAL